MNKVYFVTLAKKHIKSWPSTFSIHTNQFYIVCSLKYLDILLYKPQVTEGLFHHYMVSPFTSLRWMSCLQFTVDSNAIMGSSEVH